MAVKPELCGPFELCERIHAGDRADLFRAQRTGPDGKTETVALKRLLPSLASDPGQRAAMRREAGRVAGLSHPSVPRLLERGAQAGVPYFAMEYVAGTPLAALITRGRLDSTPMPLAAAGHLGLALADALEHLHGRGPGAFPGPRAHGNLGAHSVCVRADGHVWLTGLRGDLRTTSRLAWLDGNPTPTSPEQAAGRRPDERTDVYALGALLWHALFGLPGFAGRNEAELRAKVVAGEMSWPSDLRGDVPEELQEILFMALDTDPDERFQTVAGFAQMLRTCVDSQGWTHGQDVLAAWALEFLPEEETELDGDDIVAEDLEPEVIELTDTEIVLEEDEEPGEDSTRPIELARLPTRPGTNELVWEDEELNTLPFAG